MTRAVTTPLLDRTRNLLVLVVALGAWTYQDTGPKTRDPEVERRIAYYSSRVAEDPSHYPSWALLGEAWLDATREDWDPKALAEARRSLRRSLELQVNYEALKAFAQLESFAHRFEDALAWVEKAKQAMPEDRQLLSIQIDALLGLGRLSEAGELLEPFKQTGDFYTAASVAAFQEASGDWESAIESFSKASRLAAAEGVAKLQSWSLVRAAGVLLDRRAGDLSRARELLESAALILPRDPVLRFHQAELAEAKGEDVEALSLYQALLSERPNFAAYRSAIRVSRRLRRDSLAQQYFDEAEALCRRPLEAGERFSLLALAGLYCDSGVKLKEAAQLLERSGAADREAAAVKSCLMKSQGGR